MSRRWQLVLLWLASVIGVVWCHGYGSNYMQSPTGYITYMVGDMDLILTVPHGGSLRPDDVPDRTYGCWSNGGCVYTHNCGTTSRSCKATVSKDLYSAEIAMLLAEEIMTSTGGRRPHIIINNLHRSKLDMNREVALATFGVPEMVTEYSWYTYFINLAKYHFSGAGILFDIHGVAGHSEEWVEIGYRISNAQLNSGSFRASDTSIRALGERKCGSNSYCFNQLIRGSTSFGQMLSYYGHKVIPSPTHPAPGSSGYYRGGYTTQVHGSMAGGNVDAIQVETPSKYRNAAAAPAYARDLATAIMQYYQANYYYV